MEVLAGLNWVDIGSGALVAAFVLLILTGRIVPRSTMDAQVQVWKDAYELEKAGRVISDEQVRQLTETLSTTDDVIRALRSTAAPEDKEVR